MTKEEFLERIEKIPLDGIDNDFFIEYNAIIYDLLDQLEQLKGMLSSSDNLNKWKKLRKRLESGLLKGQRVSVDTDENVNDFALATFVLVENYISEKDVLKAMDEIEEEERM